MVTTRLVGYPETPGYDFWEEAQLLSRTWMDVKICFQHHNNCAIFHSVLMVKEDGKMHHRMRNMYFSILDVLALLH